MSRTRITSAMLDAARGANFAPIVDALTGQRQHIARLQAAKDAAERQVRDMARENARLRAENARLQSVGGEA